MTDAKIEDVAEEIFPPDSCDDFHPTDAGNARRFAHQHAATLKYCPSLKKWFAWDGRRWRVDDDRTEVMRRAKDTARSLYRDAANCLDTGKRRELVATATKLEGANRIEAMIRLAQSEHGISIDAGQFDSDPMLLCVANGVLNLRTAELKSHDPALLMTKLAPVNYLPDADCRKFLEFLNCIFAGNQNLIAFLGRALGYALTGLTYEQCLFMLHGSGANGKSTLIELLRRILGDFAVQSPSELLLTKRHADGGPSPQLVRLQGARFVTAVEADADRNLAEAIVKQTTGQDTIAARDLHSQFVEFRPQFKLFMAVNQKPNVRGRDEGIWRRIKLIPFAVTIPEDERDRKLLEKLFDEAPGILAWLVQGCLSWQKIGLAVPPEVQAATMEYREETDDLAEFIDERLIADAKGFISSDELAGQHGAWSLARGQEKLSATRLGRAFASRSGVVKCKRGGRRGFEGYRARAET